MYGTEERRGGDTEEESEEDDAGETEWVDGFWGGA